MFNQDAKMLVDGYKVEGDLLVKMDGSMCVGVYHIGKFPQVFHSSHYKNGHSWNIRYRGITLAIPNPVSFLKYRLGDLATEIKYAIKSYFTVKSGYVQMESKFSDNDGFSWQEADPGFDDPYYVCARFGNDRHIPVPILSDWTEDENRLQKWAIRLAGGAPEAMKEAEVFVYDD